MKERTTRLAGPGDCVGAIEAAAIGDPVMVVRTEDGGGLLFLDGERRLLGRLTARHEAAKCMGAGEVMLHCSVNSITAPSAAYPRGAVNVRIVTGSDDERFEMPAARSYPVGIVGESHYQSAIARCRAGDAVILVRELDNPHDRGAVVVKSVDGATLGYLPRDGWLRDAIQDEGRGASARILSIHAGLSVALVLDVALGGAPVGVSAYELPPNRGHSTAAAGCSTKAAPPEAIRTPARVGWWKRLIGR